MTMFEDIDTVYIAFFKADGHLESSKPYEYYGEFNSRETASRELKSLLKDIEHEVLIEEVSVKEREKVIKQRLAAC